jgi:hypothetical protein
MKAINAGSAIVSGNALKCNNWQCFDVIKSETGFSGIPHARAPMLCFSLIRFRTDRTEQQTMLLKVMEKEH